MTRRPPSNFFPRLADSPLLLLALGAVLYSIRIWRGLYIDEYTTWWVARMPLGEMIEQRLQAGHLPGYFLFMTRWTDWVGDAEWQLRFPSYLCSLAGLEVFRRIARELLGRRTGGLAAFIYLIHELSCWSAQTARPYAPMLLFLLLGCWALLRFWRGGRGGWLVLMTGAFALAILCHALATIVLASCLIALLWRWRGAAKGRAVAASAAIVVTLLIMFAPLLFLEHRQSNYEARKIGFPLWKGMNSLAHVVFGDYDFYEQRVSWLHDDPLKYGTWLAIGLVVWGAVGRLSRIARRAPASNFPIGPLLAMWALVPWIVLIVFAGFATKSTLGQERYFALMVPVFAMLVALGLREWSWRLREKGGWRCAPTIVCFALMAPCTVGWLAERGDGPHLLAPQIAEPAVYAGDPMPLRYEFRGEDKRIVRLKNLSIGDARATLQKLAGEYERIWLFIYDNHADDLDPLMKKPPAPWHVVKRVEAIDARAVLLERE